jgi:YtkA-like
MRTPRRPPKPEFQFGGRTPETVSGRNSFSERPKVTGTRSLGICASSLCLLAPFPLTGCSKPNQQSSDVNFKYESQPNPPHVGSNTFVVKLTEKNDLPLSGARVSLEGDMSHAGMSPISSELKEVGAGMYRGDLNLGMRGDWILEFHIVLADGHKIEREAQLKNVKE